MSKARPRTTRLRLITAALGIVALVVFGFVTHWNPVAWYHAWRIGYYIHWTPDGVVPSYSRSNHLAPGGLVAVEIRGGNPDPRAAIWDSKSGELELIDPLPERTGDLVHFRSVELGSPSGPLTQEQIIWPVAGSGRDPAGLSNSVRWVGHKSHREMSMTVETLSVGPRRPESGTDGTPFFGRARTGSRISASRGTRRR